MDLKLKGENISLIDIELIHLDGLLNFSTNPLIWEFLPVLINNKEDILKWYEDAKNAEKLGKEIPFIIQNNKTLEILGSTRIFDLDTGNKKAEIGWTWINPQYFGYKINLEAKLLLLDFCFTNLKLNRIQFKTDEQNIRSQKAIKKIGATQEGVLRNNKIRKDGTVGNSLIYSIIISEWEDVKRKITNQLIELGVTCANVF